MVYSSQERRPYTCLPMLASEKSYSIHRLNSYGSCQGTLPQFLGRVPSASITRRFRSPVAVFLISFNVFFVCFFNFFSYLNVDGDIFSFLSLYCSTETAFLRDISLKLLLFSSNKFLSNPRFPKEVFILGRFKPSNSHPLLDGEFTTCKLFPLLYNTLKWHTNPSF